MKQSLILLAMTLIGLAWLRLSETRSISRELEQQVEAAQEDSFLTIMGNNSSGEVVESSGLATSSYIENAIWTHNDSGHPSNLFMLGTGGKLIARVELKGAKNVDWEAMAQFDLNGESYLAVADVGDNSGRRKSCQIYLFREPKLTVDGNIDQEKLKTPILKTVEARKLEFTYPEGPRDCEAIAVDVLSKQIWLTEKVFYDARRTKVPGIYVLPLNLAEPDKPLVARRIADFPIRSVTGMAFSADGKRLIIRNYVNAHLYSRTGDESWEQVVSTSRPQTVVLPLQRQGEAICFSRDSKSVLLTSEVNRQPIWRVSLKTYLDKTTDPPSKQSAKTPLPDAK